MNKTRLVVTQAVASEFEPALRLVFAHLAPDQQRAQISRTMHDKASLDGVFVAKRAEEIIGATWCHVLPGHTAVVWPPRQAMDEARKMVGWLYDAVCQYMTAKKVRLAQCLVNTDSGPDAEGLRGAGFDYATDLLYMVSSHERFPECPLGCELTYQPYTPADHQRLASLVEQTYQGTLDCPALDGVRSIQDVLMGYQATGEYDPSRWLFIQSQTGDAETGSVGCLLLADHPRDKQWELIYMGLVPEARGRGWGLEATRQAQWQVRQAGRDRLVLAVDATNKYAVRVYAEAGFVTWDRRSVFTKILGK